VFPLNLYARVPPFAVCIGTRDRGCSAHPVFPAPSDFRGGQTKMQTSGDQRREKAKARQLFEIESEILPSSLRTQGPIATERNWFARSLLSCLFQ